MFLAPVVMGAAAAKQLLVKVILFVFPFVSYFFKLCPYYKHTKYHHHQHHIKHIHHVPPSLHHTIDIEHPLPSQHTHDDSIGYYTDGPSAYE